MTFERIAAIDDQPDGRMIMRDWIENLFGEEAETVEFDRPPATGQGIAQWVKEQKIDAVLIDHKLHTRGYSRSSGLHIAAELNDAHIPTVPMTSYDRANIRDYVWYSRRVPGYVQKGHASDLPEALEIAVKRVKGEETRETRPYETILRIDSLDDDEAGLIIPAFSTSELLLVRVSDLRARVQGDLVEGLRLRAQVNLGARSKDELYLENLTVLPPVGEKYAALLRP